jgi:hypothetical protein
MDDKFDHTSVDYRDGEADKRCGVCTMFRAPSTCTEVASPVSREGLCDLFRRRKGDG